MSVVCIDNVELNSSSKKFNTITGASKMLILRHCSVENRKMNGASQRS